MSLEFFLFGFFLLNSLNSLNSTKLKLCLVFDVVIKVVFVLANYKELCSERKKLNSFLMIIEDYSFN